MTRQEIRKVAVVSETDERTVERYLAGQPVRELSAVRIRRAMGTERIYAITGPTPDARPEQGEPLSNVGARLAMSPEDDAALRDLIMRAVSSGAMTLNEALSLVWKAAQRAARGQS